MKKIAGLIILFLIIASLPVLSACSVRFNPKDADDEITSSDDEENEQAGDDQPSANPEVSKEPEESPTPSIEEVAEDVIEVGWENTIGSGTPISDLDKYGMNNRLLGLIDDSSPYVIEDHINGIIMTGSSYIMNERFEDDIYTDIKLGDSFEDIRKILGNPGWETDSILLYRTWNYYILFQGNGEAQYAVLCKAPDTQYDKYILSTVIHELNADDYQSLDEALLKIDPQEAFFGDRGFINGGGNYANSDYGITIIDFDEKYIEVYNNYQGNLFDHAKENPRYEVRFLDRDMTIESMLNAFNNYLEVDELFKSEGVVSPDGKLSAVFEWVYSMDQHFIVRTLDNSIQDRYIYAATLSKFYWLTNSHLVYIDAYNELPYAIDVNFSDPSAMNILYEAGIIKERDVDPGKYQFEITEVKNNVLTLKDTINNKTYKIEATAGKNGQTTFKAL